MKKITIEEFKNRVKKISNDTIDLGNFVFENTQSKSICKCKICGYEWEARAYSILQGHGCRKCYDKRNSESKVISLEEIQKKINENGSKTDIIDEYIDTKHKCKAKCQECGNVWYPNVSDLIKGHGCPICGLKKQGLQKRISEEEYKRRCLEKYGDKYDLSKLNFTSFRDDVFPICKIHGEFKINANVFLNGKGCPKCIKNEELRKKTETFINKANYIQNNRYNYSKVKYINNKTKICIICPVHGEFWQTPKTHLKGGECPKCRVIQQSQIRRKTREEFIETAKKIHNDKYDYSKVDYVNNSTNICIICPTHGEFYQTPSTHLNGHGCPKCAIEKVTAQHILGIKEFIRKGNIIHNNKYDYSNSVYEGNKQKIKIKCPIHGDFWQTPHDHLQGCGCPKCSIHFTKAETEITELLKEVYPQQHNKTILSGKEIDIFISSLKLGIEYNGLVWHSEMFKKDKHYHIYKLNKCNEKGIRLIHIFEDEWVNHKEICESKLKQICGLNHNPKIYGRKCTICKIENKEEVYKFLDEKHIQGRTGFTVGLGCYYNNKLMGVMTFKQGKEGYWDLNRFATDINYQCLGIGGKLFKYFIRNYPFTEIKSFADRRWTIDPYNNLYTKLGFEFDSYVPPTYWYYNPKVDQYKRFHKFGFRKQHLHKQYGLPLTMTEREMTESLGYTRIWDCGLIKYIYKKQ